MRILFFTDNFPPECNAPAIRTFEHCRRWISQGAEVTVITGAPNFPEGKVYSGYRNAWRQVEMMEGIRVVRVKTYIAANEGFFRRTLDYLSFMLAGFVGALREGRPDIVIGTSPQFFAAWAAYFTALWKRRPFVLEVRDLWPDSIVEVGAMREGKVIKFLRALEYFIYRRANAIVTVTQTFKDHVKRAGVDDASIFIVMNGTNSSLFENSKSESPEELPESRIFRVGYIGTLGMAHGLDTILLSASILMSTEPNVRFSFTGSGAEKQRLVAFAEKLQLSNVEFRPRVDRGDIPKEWHRLDVGLVVLRDRPVFSTVIPSKIFEGMASGTPLVVSMPPGEATRLVENEGIGICVPPERPEELAAIVRTLRKSPERRLALHKSALERAYKYDRVHQADTMYSILKSIV